MILPGFPNNSIWKLCFQRDKHWVLKTFQMEQSIKPHYCHSVSLIITRLRVFSCGDGLFVFPLLWASIIQKSSVFIEFFTSVSTSFFFFLSHLGLLFHLPVLQEVARACSHQRVVNQASRTCLCSTVGWTDHSHKWRRSSRGWWAPSPQWSPWQCTTPAPLDQRSPAHTEGSSLIGHGVRGMKESTEEESLTQELDILVCWLWLRVEYLLICQRNR